MESGIQVGYRSVVLGESICDIGMADVGPDIPLL